MQSSTKTALRMIAFVAWVATDVIADQNYSAHIDALQGDLLLDYNKDQAPRPNSTSPVVVRCEFMLTTVLDFNELTMELSVYGYFSANWIDPRMTWDILERYGYIGTVLLPLAKVWVPPLMLLNPSENVSPLAQSWMSVRYVYDGSANWGAGDNFKTLCKVDVEYFPFDTQKCVMEVYPPNYIPSEMKVNATADDVVRNKFTENGQWQLTDSKVVVTEYSVGYSVYEVHLHLKRRPEFFIVNILLPVVFMAILNVFVFALPPEAGERVSYCVTVLLSIAVFLTLLGDNIPKTSSPMSLLGYFLITELSLSVFICVATILNLRLFHKSEKHPIPTWLRSAVRAVDCMFCKTETKDKKLDLKKTQTYPLKPEMNSEPETHGYIREASFPPKYTPRLSFTQDTHNAPVNHRPPSDALDNNPTSDTDRVVRPTAEAWSDPGSTEDDPVTWHDVSRMVDKLLATCSALVIILCITAFYGLVIRHTE